MARDVAVLVSGSGRSLENLLDRIDAKELDCRIVLVVSSRPGVRALEIAERRDVPAVVIDSERRLDAAAYGAAVFDRLDEQGCELCVLAGFLRILEIPERWAGRVLNIHPSLLPAFGGKGFYGERVHRAVLERGCKFSGCTVHYVTNDVDGGPILVQRCVPVLPDDTVESLAARVFEEEKQALPEAIARHFER